ncbi:MAG: hypothetical protein EPN94_03065 [Nitrospirae bacterium]|nr:MAG: hypothetical protein EPN94_03065 [Nitrospirota bacterium]
MIIRWAILGLLCFAVLALSIDMYKEAIIYDPLKNIEVSGRETANNGKQASPVFEAAWSKDIADNNLFSSSRSAVQPKPQPLQGRPPEPPPKKPELYLRGIILDQFGDYVAYIEKDRAKATAVRKGDRFDDVEVVDVQQKSVELRWNEENILLSLDRIKTIKNRGK